MHFLLKSFIQNVIAQNVDIRLLEVMAVEVYQECPRFVTIVTHADRSDDSPIHCFLAKPFLGPKRRGDEVYHRDFIVPEQSVILLQDNQFGLFSLLKVMESDGNKVYWLLSSTASRRGFVINYDDLPTSLLTEEEREEDVAA